MLSSSVFSSLYHKFAHYDGGLLFEFLSKNLTHIPSSEWEKRANYGGIYVNGLLANQDQTLPTPASIEYYEPKYPIEDAEKFFPKFSSDWIVFEDQFILVSYKPAGLPTMPAKEQNKYSLRSYLDKYVGHAVHCPSRLDTSTQGLVIVSKDSRTHGLLQQVFEHKRIRKEYRFVTDAVVDWEFFEANQPIGKSPEHPVLRCINGTNAKSAHTRFEKIRSIESGGTVIRALPTTGRTHQIRVHSSAHGFPIRFDKFYSSYTEMPKGPLCLLSYAISLKHPVTDENLVIQMPDNLLPTWIID